MSSFYVNLPTLEDVKAFSRLANQIECEIDVCTGRYVVNGKSIMGLFSIDLSRPVMVRLAEAGPEAETLKRALAKYVHEN